jgi:type IV pilus assembly protein PilW
MRRTDQGFTLVELLVSMVIAGVVSAAIYSTYHTQQKSYMLQEQLTAMQQNLRAAMFYMAREIRMAGLDPTRSANFGVTNATSDRFSFTLDKNRDGDIATNERVVYALDDSDDELVDKDNKTVAENIDALNFVYLDASGDPLADPVPLTDIRSVEVTIVARTGRADPGYTDTNDYRNKQGNIIFTPAAGDNFRRQTLRTQIKCRNLGL